MDIGLDGHDGVARLRFECMHWMQLLLMLVLMLLHAAAVRVDEQITHPIVDDLLRIVQEERFARDAAIGRGRRIHAPIAHGIHIEPIVGQQCVAPAGDTTTSATACSSDSAGAVACAAHAAAQATHATRGAIKLLRRAARLLRVQSIAVLARNAYADASSDGCSGSHRRRMQVKGFHVGAERG